MQSDSDDQSDYSDSELEADLLPLHQAAAKNDVEQLTKLLSQNGVAVDLRDESEEGQNRTALHVAAIYNFGSSHFEVAEILLNNGADPNAKDTYNSSGLTPLWYLVRHCDLKILKLFLTFKADYNWLDEDESSLLSSAVQNYHNLDVLKFIVQDLGLDVNHRDQDGQTPLHFAACSNKNDSHYKVLEYLLEVGANPNAKDVEGNSPLYDLVRRGNWRVVELFLNHNANLYSVNNYGRNLFFAFHDKNSDTRVLQKLIVDYGFDVSHTLLHDIIDEMENRFIEVKVIKCLLKNGADINALDKNGVTPLIAAVVYISKTFDEEQFFENLDLFDFLIDQTDFNFVYNKKHIFYNYNYGESYPKYLWEWILKHLAKLKFLSIPIHSIIQEYIDNKTEYNDYFANCTRELEMMRNTKPKNSWINYFNLLEDNRRKLKNYASNKDLIEDYESNDWMNKFPIYEALMKKNLKKGIKRRELFDESAFLLSDCLPIFNSTHLIVNDILDCVLGKKDLLTFCE